MGQTRRKLKRAGGSLHKEVAVSLVGSACEEQPKYRSRTDECDEESFTPHSHQRKT